MNIQLIILLFSAIYLISFSLMMHTKNVQSAIVFNIIPFFIGIVLLFLFCVNIGWVQL